MNKSFLFGVFFVGAVIYYGILSHAKSPYVFLDPHAILIVLGGTVAAGLIAFQGQSVSRLVDFVLWGALFRRQRRHLKVAKDLAAIRNSYLAFRSPPASDAFDPFLREGIEFLFDRKSTTEGLVELLKTRSLYFTKLYRNDAKVLAGLAKYPPAFGLLGAATGMIEMMQNLGSSGSSGIGQSMAVALVSTFWGIATANFIILPLADAAARAAQDDANMRDLVIDGMKLIKEEVGDQQFKGHLRGYLSLEERHGFTVVESIIRPSAFAKQNERNSPVAPLPSAKPVEAMDLRVSETVKEDSEVYLETESAPLISKKEFVASVDFDQTKSTNTGTQLIESTGQIQDIALKIAQEKQERFGRKDSNYKAEELSKVQPLSGININLNRSSDPSFSSSTAAPLPDSGSKVKEETLTRTELLAQLNVSSSDNVNEHKQTPEESFMSKIENLVPIKQKSKVPNSDDEEILPEKKYKK